MILKRINEFDPNRTSNAEHANIIGFDVVSDLIAGVMTDVSEERIGTLSDILVDETGALQYLVINLGNSTIGRLVLLPGNRVRVDRQNNRVYATGITRQQAEALPEFSAQSARSGRLD
jgi:hypothetical protein